MTTAATRSTQAQAPGAGYGAVSEAQLLDVLYEIMAQGGDPHGELSGADVGAFLHEHARSPKSAAEMRAFFARHQLSTDPDVYKTDPELGEVASGLHRDRASASCLVRLDDAAPLEEPVTGARAMPGPPSRAAAHVATQPVTQSTVTLVRAPSHWLRASVAVLGVGLLSTLALGHGRARQFEDQLGQARLQQQTTDAALTALEHRTITLRAALRDSDNGRRALEDVLRAHIAAQVAQRAAEQTALQTLLGPRYQTLTQKALSEAR